MKEQLHAPIGEGTSETKEKGNAPKKLERPVLPQALPNVAMPKGRVVGYRCACGGARPKYGGCKVIPVYADEGWSGDIWYDGTGKPGDEFTVEEWREFRKGPVA